MVRIMERIRHGVAFEVGFMIANDNVGIVDKNNNELLDFVAVSSAVNEFQLTNSATGNAIDLAAIGGDTNVSIDLTPKGNGYVLLPSAGEGLRLGGTDVFSTPPTHAVIFKTGTAPAGAITTSGAIFTDGTVMKKIIAAGTVSNIET